MAATPKMQTWLKMEAGRRMVTGEERRRREAEIANAVERQMEPKNFKYEVRRNGKWEEIAESELEVVAE